MTDNKPAPGSKDSHLSLPAAPVSADKGPIPAATPPCSPRSDVTTNNVIIPPTSLPDNIASLSVGPRSMSSSSLSTPSLPPFPSSVSSPGNKGNDPATPNTAGNVSSPNFQVNPPKTNTSGWVKGFGGSSSRRKGDKSRSERFQPSFALGGSRLHQDSNSGSSSSPSSSSPTASPGAAQMSSPPRRVFDIALSPPSSDSASSSTSSSGIFSAPNTPSAIEQRKVVDKQGSPDPSGIHRLFGKSQAQPDTSHSGRDLFGLNRPRRSTTMGDVMQSISQGDEPEGLPNSTSSGGLSSLICTSVPIKDPRSLEPLVSNVFPVPLPESVFHKICSYLLPADIVNASLVSKAWYHAFDDPHVWSLYSSLLGLPLAEFYLTEKAEAEQSATKGGDPSLHHFNIPRKAIDTFHHCLASLSREELAASLFKPILAAPLMLMDDAGLSGPLSVRQDDSIVNRWKKRYALVWKNCFIVYAAKKDNEIPIMLISLSADLKVELSKHNSLRLSCKNGPLCVYSLDTSQLVTTQKSELYLSFTDVESLRSWASCFAGNIRLSRHIFGDPRMYLLRKTRLFGVSLTEIMDAQDKYNLPFLAEGRYKRRFDVPVFYQQLMFALEAKGISEVGIFRVSGNNQEVQELSHKLEEGESVQFIKTSPHTLSSVLKSFFRQMPEPLVPTNITQVMDGILLKLFHQSGDGEKVSVPPDTVKELAIMLKSIPPANFCVLRDLTRFLNKVSERSSVNKMTRNNLFIVLIPTLRTPASVLSLCMDYWNDIFA